jgi:hypothetical protein
VAKAKAGQSFVVTTGAGSGKSLCFFVPIIDAAVRARAAGESARTRAIIVYPMNALAYSQMKELQKFIDQSGLPEELRPTFARYTGQESDEERGLIRRARPDILLTNFMMLELLVTRQGEFNKSVIRNAEGFDFLVLDELHTYRGRQGADVAMLVRRMRDRLCRDKAPTCIGTSATMASEGAEEDRAASVAYVRPETFSVLKTNEDPQIWRIPYREAGATGLRPDRTGRAKVMTLPFLYAYDASPEVFRTIRALIKLDHVESVSCPFDDVDLWRDLIAEQVRRAARLNVAPQNAFTLCGPDSGLEIDAVALGGEVHIPYEGVVPADLFVIPHWRVVSVRQDPDEGPNAALLKQCRYVLIQRDLGELANAWRTVVGNWWLYESMKVVRRCNTLGLRYNEHLLLLRPENYPDSNSRGLYIKGGSP